MSRGDRREPIFLDDEDRKTFLRTLGEVCEKTGWQVHAYCLMGNHFHLVAETPQPNLVAGMKWFLGTYTGRFNRRHQFFGHLFSGRYKSLVVDERTPGYLRTACDYVHLNPVRAGLVQADAPLSAYPWSSFPLYVSVRRRPPWLRVDRLLGEHGIQEDSAKGRIEFQRRMEQCRSEGESPEMLASLRRGWRLGAADFLQRLTEKLGVAANDMNWLVSGARRTRSVPTRSSGKVCKKWDGLKRIWTVTRKAILTRSPLHTSSDAKPR